MALQGYDPNYGPSGGYPLGTFQGGPDPNAPGYLGGRDAITAAVLAQQGFPLGNINYQGHSPASAQTGEGPFGGRGGTDREGFGTNVSDPALASPSFTDPGYSNVSVFGREGDTTAPSSQAAQASQAAAMAAAAAQAQTGGYGLPAGGFAAGGGKTGAPAATGWGGWSDYATTPTAGAPSTYGSSTFAQPGAAPVSTTSITAPGRNATGLVDVFESGYNDFFGAPPAGNLFEGQSFNTFAGAREGNAPTMVGTVHPSGYTQPGVPGVPGVPGEPGDPSDPSDPGNSSPGWGGGGPISGSGFGGFGAFGGGAATGGYEGSASMGNTTGAQGFTAGGGGFGDFGAASPGTGGFTAGGGFADPGATPGGFGMGFGGSDGTGAGTGDTGGGGQGNAGGNDPGGGGDIGGGVG